MVVAQLRGMEFELDSSSRVRVAGYYPILDYGARVWKVLEEVAQAFGYENSDDYLSGLDLYGKKSLERLK
jgi:hypothetical protein